MKSWTLLMKKKAIKKKKVTRKKKKKTLRSKQKYPQFDPRFSPRVRAEYMDIDYADKLPEDEFVEGPNGKMMSVKEWYHKFLSEYDAASLDYKELNNNFHNTPELKKECTDRNNARNRCAYGIAKAGERVTDMLPKDSIPNNFNFAEDTIIDLLDAIHAQKEDDY